MTDLAPGRDAELPRVAPLPARSWRSALAEALFVPEEGGPRRRPADALVAILGVALLLATATRIESSTTIELSFAELLNRLPSDVAGIAGFLYRLGALWFVGITAAAMAVGGRRRLAQSVAAAGVGAWLVGRSLIAAGGSHAPPASIVVRYGHLQSYPVVRVAVAVAVLCVAAPHITVLARRVGWTIALVDALSALFLGVGLPNDVFAGALVGLVVGSAVKFVAGSPAGRPTLAQLRRALAEVGIDAADLAFDHSEEGVTTLTGHVSGGGLVHVKAYGRDERDAQLIAKAWRFVWYSESGPALVFTRLQQVEHEAYVLLRAERADVPVPDVLAAAMASSGTALLVTSHATGTQASTLAHDAIDDALLDRIWQAVAGLGDARIAHGAIDLAHVIVTATGAIELTDFGSAITSAGPTELAADRARVLAATALAVGAERAVQAAKKRLAGADLAATVAFLQPPVLTDAVRHELRREHGLLADLRTRAAAAAGVAVPEPARLERVRPRSLAITALTFVGVYLMLGQLASFRDLGTQLHHVHWGWIAAAVVCSAATNIGFAVAYTGAAPIKVPFGSVTALQAAGGFTGLIAPGGVGTTAMNLRFLHVRGVPVVTAAAASLVNTVASTVVNLLLLVAVLPASGAKVDLGRIPWRGVLAVALLVVAVVGIVGAIAWRLPRIQRLYREQVRPAVHDMLEVARSPSKLALVLGGNLSVSILYGLTLLAISRGFGDGTSFTTLLFVNIAVSYLTGVVPVPGGLGVAEAGLAAGLSSVGVVPTIAVAMALSYRLIVTWLPPIPGWFALRYLDHQGDL